MEKQTGGVTEQGGRRGESMHCNADTFCCEQECLLSSHACANSTHGSNYHNIGRTVGPAGANTVLTKLKKKKKVNDLKMSACW